MYAEDRGWLVEARSAGTDARDGDEAAANSRKAIAELGGNLTNHRSQAVTEELVAWADRILVMEIRHASAIREQFRASDEKVLMLGTFGGIMEIGDPYGSWIFKYRSSRNEIRRCVEVLLDRMPPRLRGD